MKKIACIAIESVFISIDPNRLNNTFEVFGLDFMIDANFKVYLIEINTNPDITACCTLLQRLIPTMKSSNSSDELCFLVAKGCFCEKFICSWGCFGSV